MNTKFLIVSAAYNVESWIEQTFMSVLTQRYDNWKWIFMDDCSTDKTVENLKSLTERFPDKKDRVIIVEKTIKECSLYNIVDAINNMCCMPNSDETVIIILDGDDWFTGPDVLQTLDKVYKENNCWLTYGSYLEYPSYRMGSVHSPYPEKVVEERSFRKADWHGSHLRSFKYGLFKHINQNDFKDKDGNFYDTAGDLALMFPMLEMSGGRFRFITDILYVYNIKNPLNDFKQNATAQLRLEKLIRNRPRYEAIV